VETTSLDTRTNWVTWIGLASYGRTYLVPMGHTKGRMIRSGYEEKVLPPEEEREVLKSGKLSQRKITRKVPPVFAPPPQQLDPAIVFAELEPLFFGDQVKVAWNARFDLLSISKYYGGVLPSPPYEDPMLMTHILDENRRNYELKDTVLDWLNIVNPVRRKSFYPKLGKTIQDEPIDGVARYLAKDAYLLWLYWKQVRAQIDRADLRSILRLEMDLYPALMRMHLNGAAIDLDAIEDVERELAEEIERWEERAWTIVKHDFPLTNNNIKRDLLFKPKKEGGQGLKPLNRTPKTGAPKLDAYTLEHYAPINPLAHCFQQHAELSKLYSTYVVGIRSRAVTNGRGTFIHTSFTQHRTVTGRLSSTEPNLQNIPRGSVIRRLFIAPPGCLLVVADYDQIELRVFAHMLNDPVMKTIFMHGLDIHAETAAFILGKPSGDLDKEERNTAGKVVNFAVSYGAGLMRLMAAGIPEETAKVFLDLYFRRFATIKPWRRAVLLEAHRRGDKQDSRKRPPYVSTLLGRRRRLPDLYDFDDRSAQSRAERQAWNHVIQGTAAEIMKIAMIRVDRAFLGTPYKLSLTVHDELLAIAPEDQAEQCKQVMTTAMSGIMLGGKPILSVPLVVSCGIARAWSEAKG
jgi:DNA polymerase-1